MKVEFIKPGIGLGLGYLDGMVGDVPDNLAKKAIELGIAIPIPQEPETTDDKKAKKAEKR